MKRLFILLFFITSLFLVSCNNVTEETNNQQPTTNNVNNLNTQFYAIIIKTGETENAINYEWTIYYTISPILFKECTLNGRKYTFTDNERGFDKEMSGKINDYCYNIAEGKYSNNQDIVPKYNTRENRQYTEQENLENMHTRTKSRTDEIIKNFKKSIVWE